MTRIAPLAVVVAVLIPAVAEAHLVVTGMGPIFDGVTHFALSPEDILPVLALAGFAGLRGPRPARLSLAFLLLSWLAASVVTGALGLVVPAVWLAAATAGLLLAAGGVLAADLDLSPGVCAGGATIVGVLRGAADLSGAGSSGGSVLNALGMVATAGVLFALAASVTLPLRRLWMIIAARVAGSWIAAVGLLLAGWISRYGAGVT